MLTNLVLAFRQGDMARAHRLAEESLSQQREIGYAIGVSDTLFHLALFVYGRESSPAPRRFAGRAGTRMDDRALQRVVFPLDRLAILRRRWDGTRRPPAYSAPLNASMRLGLVRDKAVNEGRDRALSGTRSPGKEGFDPPGRRGGRCRWRTPSPRPSRLRLR